MSSFPADWPGAGPIDLAVHDLPHASSTTEWWYQNGHLTAGGKRYAFFAAFFQQVKGYDEKTRDPLYAHSITWSLIDLDGEHNHFVARVDRSAPAEGLKRVRRGLGGRDPRFSRALSEILERDNVPLPDRMFDGRVLVNTERLNLQYGPNTWRKVEEGRYRLTLSDDGAIGVDLEFELKKPPIRHGDDGVVRGPDDETMFYYFVPRCAVTGTVTYRGIAAEVTEGSGWYDHEFGRGEGEEEVDDGAEAKLDEDTRKQKHKARWERHEKRQVAWDWLSVQLDDGSELSVYHELYPYQSKSAGKWAVVISPDGEQKTYAESTFEATRIWRSTQTFFEYPVDWKVTVPEAGIELEVKAAFEDQEFITLISKPSFWEGRIDATGTVNGKAVLGRGVIERSGYASYEDLEGFFEEVGKVVRESVERVVPMEPTRDQAMRLIGSPERAQYVDGVDPKQYGEKHLHPIREIVDRGGKGWRSYAAITCCDIVGGDSRKFIDWIALPELMHVGSLIVDDVQDKSVTRRGGKTAHLIYGEPQAINSGTAAYFIGIHLLNSDFVSDADQIRIYKLYFEALRAGHAGQAIDLDGFAHMMDDVVARGDATVLEQRVLAVHRLKTAAPAGCLARIGALGGGGTEDQVEGVGLFFEALGLAFQIIDDVLNLRGFKGDLKAKAEDIQQGKVTLPVAKALGRLEKADRKWLWETLQTHPEDPQVIQAVLDKLDSCNAIDDCSVEARELVEDAWHRLAPLVDDSLSKMLLRAFGWYVLERHY